MNGTTAEGRDERLLQYWDRRAKELVEKYSDRGFDTTKAAIFRKMDVIIERNKDKRKGSLKDLNEFEALGDQLNQLALAPKRALREFRAEACKELTPAAIDTIESTLKAFESDVDNALQTAEDVKKQIAQMRAEFE
jgi:hypothetical protein